jgi:hypothetical protein
MHYGILLMTNAYYERIEGKKNLLIALGDSWTRGFGSYPNDILKKYSNPPMFPTSNKVSPSVKKDMDFLYNDYMPKHSWAYVLSKKLGYDLINLGAGGFANSSIAKTFYNNVSQNDYSNYEQVLVIGLMSSPARISFYVNADFLDLNLASISSMNSKEHKVFCSYFLKNIQPSHSDQCLESLYYLQSIKALCGEKGFDFYYSTAFTSIDDYNESKINPPLTKINDSANNLTPQNVSSYRELLDDTEISKCYHPNELGHIKIANCMYKELCRRKYKRF